MRLQFQSVLFRGLVLATLLLAAAAFAIKGEIHDGLTHVEKKETDQGTRAKEIDKTFLGVEAEGWTAIFTGVLAIFTMGLAGVTYRLFQVTKDGMSEQGALTRMSLEHAKTSAEAALISARAAEKALEGADAPFVFPLARAFDAERDPAPPGIHSIGFACYELKNFGRSPAIVREVYHGIVRSNIVPPPIPFPPPQTNLFLDAIVGAGESSQTWRFSRGAIVDDDIPLVAFLQGQIRFNDVLGNYFVAGFCLAYRETDKVFYAIGGATHNYQRKLGVEEQEIARQRDARVQR